MFISLWWVSRWDADNERPADRCAMKWLGCFTTKQAAETYIMRRHPHLLHEHGPGHLMLAAATGKVWHGGELRHWPRECSAARLRELVEQME